MINTTKLLVTLFSLLMFSTVVNAQIVVDDFSSGGPLAQFGSGTNTQTTVGPGIIGGTRIDTLEVPNIVGAFMGILGFDGNFEVGQGSMDEIAGSLFYNSLGGVDLTDGGTLNAFQLDFVSSDDDLNSIDNSLELSVTSNGVTSSQFISIPANNSLTNDADEPPTFVDFVDFGGVDFTAVDALELAFDFASNPGTDFALAGIEAVNAIPEPGSLAVLSLGSLVLLRRRRS